MRVALLLLAIVILGCSVGGGETPAAGADGEEGEPIVDPRILVEKEVAAPGTVGDHVVASAAVESDAEAVIIPEATGLVTAVYAEEGDTVTRGQVLAIIASPSLDAAYERASAELERTQTDAAAAERLFAQGAISKAEHDTAAQALHAARTAHEEASQTRGFTRLVSPIDGVVAQRNLRYGETAGPTPAFTVVDLSRLRVVVALPERDLARVQVGQPASVVSAYDEEVSAPGKVVRVAPVVDTQTGTVRVTVGLEAGALVLRPGQFVSVRIEVARHEGVITVPRRAVVWEEGRSYAYTLLEGPPPEEPGKAGGEAKDDADKDEEGGGFSFGSLFGGETPAEEPPEVPGPYRRAHRVPVELGFEDGKLAEITGGLAVGDAVITVGNQAPRDDARVRLPEDPEMPKPVLDAEKPADAPPPAG